MPLARSLLLFVMLAASVSAVREVHAQASGLEVAPAELAVSVAQHETVARTVTLTNTGDAPLSYCLNFERPLQRRGSALRLSEQVSGSACGEYGEVLALVDTSAIEALSWDPYGLAMTPDGRLFAAERFNATNKTYELTPSLEVVRSFPHPVVEELSNSALTTGVTYNATTGTLWWLNIEGGGFDVERALLLEGDLDGVPTGQRIEIPVADSAPPPSETGLPVGLGYDPTQRHFFFTDPTSETIWAVDTLGNAVSGYPVQMEGYPGATIARGINVVPAAALDGAEAGPEGLRLELYINPPGPTPPRHIGVVGRYGEDTAPGAEPLETPLIEPLPGTADGSIGGEAVRSVLDPNGVLYYPWTEFQNGGVVAVRPHPLPPSWLVVEAWDGTLAPGESREVTLTFRAGAREVGTYTSALQAFEAATGEAVEVPLTLEVTQGTPAEETPAAGATASAWQLLAPYPNPSGGTVTVPLEVERAAEVRVSVVDVLGREVAVLHDGSLSAGAHQLALGERLPVGLYVVRAVGEGLDRSQRLVVVR